MRVVHAAILREASAVGLKVIRLLQRAPSFAQECDHGDDELKGRRKHGAPKCQVSPAVSRGRSSWIPARIPAMGSWTLRHRGRAAVHCSAGTEKSSCECP